MTLRYRLLNAFFHGLHLGIVAFICLGWIWPGLRLAHLVFILSVLATWGVFGSCPLTERHWDLKQEAGLRRPKDTYIHFLVHRAMADSMSSPMVDKLVIGSTLGLTALSLYLNLKK